MGIFGFLGAPKRFIERVTGARASRQKATAASEQFKQQQAALAQANAQSLAQQQRLQQMLDSLSGLDKQRKGVQKEYKGHLKKLEGDEAYLQGLGQHYTKTIGKVEAKGNKLLSLKGQLEERGSKLAEQAAPLGERLQALTEEAKKVGGENLKALADQFQQQYKAVEANKERLKGVSFESAPELFLKHQQMVKALGTLRQQTEGTLKSRHQELSESHRKVTTELSRLQKDYQGMEEENLHIRRGQEKLERKKHSVTAYQNMLEPELKKFGQEQEAFKAEAEGLKAFQGKLTDLEQSYATKKQEAEKLQQELSGTNAYQNQLVSRLKGLQQDVESHAQRYQERAGMAALLNAGLTGLATMGVGSALGVGGALLKLGTGLGVFGAFNSAKGEIQKNLQKFANLTDIPAEEYARMGGIPDWNKTPLNRIDFKSRVFDTKVKMPELGGLAQSIKHFDMPTLPTLEELPTLSDALGKIRPLEEVLNLGVLPGSTARSPNRSLLNPQLIKTFERLIKSMGRVPTNSNKKQKEGASRWEASRRGTPSSSLSHLGGLAGGVAYGR
jgi:hypothetical protein